MQIIIHALRKLHKAIGHSSLTISLQYLRRLEISDTG